MLDDSEVDKILESSCPLRVEEVEDFPELLELFKFSS